MGKYLIHIPKTHGRTIVRQFRSVKSTLSEHRLHLRASDLKGLEPNTDWFAVIREPTERILSLYTSHYRNSFDSFLDALETPTVTIRDPFIFSRPEIIHAPGTILANQWDYIKDSPLPITLFRFGDWNSISKFIGEEPMEDLTQHKERQKDLSLLTPERIKRIKRICSLDYKNLKPYIEND